LYKTPNVPKNPSALYTLMPADEAYSQQWIKRELAKKSYDIPQGLCTILTDLLQPLLEWNKADL